MFEAPLTHKVPNLSYLTCTALVKQVLALNGQPLLPGLYMYEHVAPVAFKAEEPFHLIKLALYLSSVRSSELSLPPLFCRFVADYLVQNTGYTGALGYGSGYANITTAKDSIHLSYQTTKGAVSLGLASSPFGDAFASSGFSNLQQGIVVSSRQGWSPYQIYI